MLATTVVRILAALDDTPQAPHVLEMALQMAAHLGGVVVPFRAIMVPPEFPPAAATNHRDELPGYLVDEATRALERLTSSAPAHLLARSTVRIGQPWRAIIEAADELSADLVVVGSHGYHGLDRLLGTTTRHVADAARHDVLVARHPPGSGGIRAVLVALSGSPRDREILERGLEVAHAWGIRAHLIRVVRIAHTMPPPPRAIVGFVEASTFESTRPLARLAASDAAIASARVAFSVAPVWRALVEAAQEEGADLIVMGAHDRRLRGGLRRTVPGHLADEAPENVLVVHGEIAA